jgi:hypothetical protein
MLLACGAEVAIAKNDVNGVVNVQGYSNSMDSAFCGNRHAAGNLKLEI